VCLAVPTTTKEVIGLVFDVTGAAVLSYRLVITKTKPLELGLSR